MDIFELSLLQLLCCEILKPEVNWTICAAIGLSAVNSSELLNCSWEISVLCCIDVHTVETIDVDKRVRITFIFT